jgi:hypothetical protein
VTGPPGTNGQDGATVTGPPGPAGADGKNGTDGKDGAPGTTQCPDGYSWQAPADDPDALICRRTTAPPTDPTPDPADTTTPLALALDPQRRQYP